MPKPVTQDIAQYLGDARQPAKRERGLRVLLVEDSADDTEMLRYMLRRAGRTVELTQVDNEAALLKALAASSDWDLVISDYNLPVFSAEAALRLARQHLPDTPFIVVSGYIGEEAAVGLMRAGADDYVMKDNLARLVPAIERSLQAVRTRRQGRAALAALHESEARFKAIASNIPGMVFQLTRSARGRLRFAYVSGGCPGLLGVTSLELTRNSDLLLGRLESPDRARLIDMLKQSARTLTDGFWEGPLRGKDGLPLKWLSLACSPRQISASMVLWDGIMDDITAAKTREGDLLRSREELARLSMHVEDIKEQERMRIAREVHDDLGGTLTAIKIELMRLGNSLAADDRTGQDRLSDAEHLVNHAMESTRRIATELRPAILDLGIEAAIEWQCQEFSKRTEVPCRVQLSGSAREPLPEIATAMFRIFQEALTNVTKHARATEVVVTLDSAQDGVHLTVRDNGRGIRQQDLDRHNAFGLRGMRERVAALQGDIQVTSRQPGTEVCVRLPLQVSGARAGQRT